MLKAQHVGWSRTLNKTATNNHDYTILPPLSIGIYSRQGLMNFPNIWNSKTNTVQTPSGSRLQAQNIPLHGVVRTMNRRRQESTKIPRRPSSSSSNHYQIPLQYEGPGAFTCVAPATPALHSPSSPVIAFFDTTFHTYSERIHTELTNLRTFCSKAIFREHQEKEKWKAHCVTFRQERDVARERVRALIGEREAQMGHDATARQSLRELRRSRSYGPLPVVHQRLSLRGCRSASLPSAAPKKNTADLLDVPDVSLSRRSSLSLKNSRSASPASSSSATAFSEIGNDPSLYCLSYPSPRVTPLDIVPPTLLPPSNANFSPLKRSHSAGPILARPPPPSDKTQDVPPLFLPRGNIAPAPSTSQVSPSTEDRAPPPPSPPQPDADWLPTRNALLKRIPAARKATLQLEHVDLMYRRVDGLLECRACRLVQNKLGGDQESHAVVTFHTSMGWDDLLDHCLMQHPTESRDIARLHPAEIFELRRRLKEKEEAA
ncbi:hypothetical protein FPV67DRAFT_1469179 [Lyophyllum atratum]|nr:hypothetical protein FPV67DRAFT_1469179 [Lyophyllum atratum]